MAKRTGREEKKMELKAKNLTANSGAESLAAQMASLGMDSGEQPLQQIALERLQFAPEEWNFFQKLPDDKFFELLQSMQDNGLLVPLIVWEQRDGSYMILSGHNRFRAAQKLSEEMNEERFLRVPCRVYRYADIDEDKAREILIDCNWVQRVLSPAERVKSISYKYAQVGRQKRGSGQRAYELVAEQFGLKPTQVYQYTRLSELDSYWLDKLDSRTLSVKAGAHLAKLDTAQQEALKQKGDALTNAEIMSVKKNTPVEEITNISQKDKMEPMREIRIFVPADQYDEILETIREKIK